MTSDEEYMSKALSLASKADPFPNPKVGCVVVKDNKIIGQGYHRKAGKPHAEVYALKDAKKSVRDATLYVTLEPCFSHGRTPPCVDKIIKENIKKVVIATKDPNPKTYGKSVEKLKKAGIEVRVGILEHQAIKLNYKFFSEIKERPFIILKIAMTKDGFIAKKGSEQISNEISQNMLHRLRRNVDAIMVGTNTARVDNPQLSSRLDNTFYPRRVILDNKGVLKNLKCFSLPGKTIVLTSNKDYKNNKAKIILCKGNNKLDLKDAFNKLKENNISSIMVEGGSVLAQSLIKDNLVDEFIFFISPKTFKTGIAFYPGINAENLKEKLKLNYFHCHDLSDDVFIRARNV